MPKRPNMVTVETLSGEHQTSLFEPSEMKATPGQVEGASSAPAEPSLAEIKEMLVDIKIKTKKKLNGDTWNPRESI